MQQLHQDSTPLRVRKWLSLYGSCCQEEGVDMHSAVLSRVVPVLDASQSPRNGDIVEAAKAVIAGDDSSVAPSTAPANTACSPVANHHLDENISLDFSGLWMTLSGWTALFRSVLMVSPLGSLSLRHATLGDSGLRCLCRHFAPTSAPPVACEAVRTGAQNTTLPPCSFEVSLLHPSHLRCPVNALRVLDLSGTGLVDVGPLSVLTTSCPLLRSLNLADNSIGASAEGLSKLCAALRLHTSIEQVDLSRNKISGQRGGVAIASLAELLVHPPAKWPRPRTTSAAVTSGCPLRVLDLSQNLLGCYYIPGSRDVKGLLHFFQEDQRRMGVQVQEGGRKAEDGALSSARDSALEGSPWGTLTEPYAAPWRGGPEYISHDAVVAFPLITALYLNNSLMELSLHDNDLPDAVVEYVEARLLVNRRCAFSASRADPAEADHVSVKAVQQTIQYRLRRAIDQARIAALAATEVRDERSGATGLPLGATHAPASLEGGWRWSTDEVESMLTSFARAVEADLLAPLHATAST